MQFNYCNNCWRTLDFLPFQPPHSANRHDADSRGAGADRVVEKLRHDESPIPANRVLRYMHNRVCAADHVVGAKLQVE